MNDEKLHMHGVELGGTDSNLAVVNGRLQPQLQSNIILSFCYGSTIGSELLKKLLQKQKWLKIHTTHDVSFPTLSNQGRCSNGHLHPRTAEGNDSHLLIKNVGIPWYNTKSYYADQDSVLGLALG